MKIIKGDPMTEARDLPFINPADVHLDDEALDASEVERRQQLSDRILQNLPKEALSRLQILQPAIGCLNRCNFCSQVAGPVTRELGSDALRTVMGGLRGAMVASGLDRVGGERMHKDGVIFPYLDNDIGSYPHLPDYLVGMSSLGGTTRISTVGWSRHSEPLQSMHETIAAEHVGHIDGIRFSLTPYTYGWRTNRDEYVADFGNALATYRPLFEQKGVGRRTACVEIRFRPDIQLGEVIHEDIGNYRVIRCEEYAMAMRKVEFDEAGVSSIAEMTASGPSLSSPGIEAVHLIGNGSDLDEAALTELFLTAGEERAEPNVAHDALTHRGRAHIFQNADGPYYCFNPLKDTETGAFSAIHYYPQTERRQVSGVLDATRPLLNNLLSIKQENGKGIREDFDTATSAEVDQLLETIRHEADRFAHFSPRRGNYIHTEVMPLVEDLITAMQSADLSPADLFRYGLVVDTGVIVNQGKAITEFQGLASQPDMPMTPNEEKGYGDVSQSSIRGNTWRISPVAALSHAVRPTGFGGKSLPLVSQDTESQNTLFLGAYEWNPQTFNGHLVDGTPLRKVRVPIGDLVDPLQKITPKQGTDNHLMPGVVR